MAKQTFHRSTVVWAVLWGCLLAGLLLGIPFYRFHVAQRQSRFDFMILQAAGENGCDPALIKAVIWRETRFDPQARGRDGEIGLMQVMPAVADEWATERKKTKLTADQLFDPATNLRVGSWYLAKALQQWSQAAEPVPLAVAQYNAGRSNVLKWVDANSMADADSFVESIKFPGTRSYVRDILGQYQLYRQRGEF